MSRFRRMGTYFISIFLVLTGIPRGDPCEVIPKDPYIEHGSNITVMFKKTCDTWNSNTHSNNFWTLNNKRINESLYETNVTFSGFTISNVTLPSVMVQFHSRVQGHEQIMGGTVIRTYQKPRNIACVTFLSQRDFVCHWDHEIQPTEKVNYTVVRQSEKTNETCRSERTSCSFKSLPIFSSTTEITVHAESMYWKTKSDPRELDLWNTVKIDPPQHVRVVPLRSSLKVDWERPVQYFSQRVMYCEVKYGQHVMNTSMSEMTASVTTAEVDQCANHTTSVRCALNKPLWSDWSRPVTVLSNFNVSAKQLNLWRKIDPPDDAGTRRVHLMWQGISPACDAIDGYKLTCGAVETLVPSSVDRTSITVDRRACRVTLVAFRGNTTFPDHTTYVPAVGESLNQVTAGQASAKNGVIHVSWGLPPGRPVNGYMIDWTADGDTYNWLQIQDTDQPLTGLKMFTLYTITVTPLYDNMTGLGKVLRICSNERGTTPSYNFLINVTNEDKSAQVSWNSKPQKQCIGAPTNYTVFYQTGTQPELSVTVDGRINEVTLEPLQPNTEYKVHIMASTVPGTANSSVAHFKTRRYGTKFVLTTTVACGVSFLFVLVVGLYCFIWWKRIMNKMVPNPGLSTLAFWSSQDCQEIQPFNHPPEPENAFEKIYPCEVDAKTDNLLGLTSAEDEDTWDGEETASCQMNRRSSGFGSRSSCDSQPAEECIGAIPDAAELPTRAQPDKGPNLVESTPSEDSQLDSLDLRVPGSCPINPYRVQTPAEEEVGRSLLETKYRGHTASSPAYITMGMFQHRRAGVGT
ncbi:hypothetical protein DPEC_G00321080 [Dallia pectoralis]|uniref:Uncharacterized protein n=1 Tax=Dallia pectoralis TaxID=75939 RepID=A0ACC2FA20_DALPE|nr:hypothetical protein DPEC_G00321080 [Dallia pectoralis]